MKVAIFLGSLSDKEKMRPSIDILNTFGVAHVDYVISAHRNPELLAKTIRSIESMEAECIIAGAGLAAHLPGVIASQTVLPVVGVPLETGLGGIDSLLSIVQMPKNIPVATVGINNSANAALLAIQILAVKYPDLKKKLSDYRLRLKEEIESQFEKGVEW
jgi:5-(carboxyamino)imidazole ribonucleotide mutase